MWVFLQEFAKAKKLHHFHQFQFWVWLPTQKKKQPVVVSYFLCTPFKHHNKRVDYIISSPCLCFYQGIMLSWWSKGTWVPQCQPLPRKSGLINGLKKCYRVTIIVVPVCVCVMDDPLILRIFQHTPETYPRPQTNGLWVGIPESFGGLGIPGVCSKGMLGFPLVKLPHRLGSTPLPVALGDLKVSFCLWITCYWEEYPILKQDDTNNMHL